MNREIKFRGKRVDDKGWICGILYYSHDKTWITDSRNINLNTHSNIAWFEVIPESVGQNTDLEDENGKEIYEGDILEGGIYKNGIVSFENGTFTVWGEPLGWDVDDFSSDAPSILLPKEWAIVIGNIYETPELVSHKQ